MELSYADQVWNRACDVDAPEDAGAGDRHLWALLRVHGMVMSGGVGYAADVISGKDFAAAVEASRYLGLEQLAGLLQSIAASTPDDDDELQARYDEIENDHLIEQAFRRQLARSPGDFRPL